MTTQAASQNSQDLRALWQEHIRRALGQPYLLMLMIGSLLLSAASFFTTFMGMLHFMPVVFVTFCIVFAIQTLLFVTSWRIGFALADREETPVFTLFVFAICLATSVFFSWVALFESINDEETQTRTRETRIHRAVEDTLAELQTRTQSFRRDQAEALIASPAYVAWTATLDRVAEEAMRARPTIEAARDTAAQDVAARIQAIEAERARVLRQEAGDAQRSTSNQATLERLEGARGALVERVSRLRAEFDEAETRVVLQEGRMEAEETGGGDGRTPGRGPFWRQLRDERNVLAAERDAKRRLFETAQAELTAGDAQIETLKAEIAAASATQGSAELDVLNRRLSELQSGVGAATATDAASLEQSVEQMRADLGAFTTRFELEPFDAAATRCGALLETMRASPALRSQVAGLSCDRSALAAFVNPLRVVNENQRGLNAACAPDGGTTRRVSGLGFEEAVAYGRECIDRAGLPSTEVADLRAEIARLVLEEDPKASQFVKTVNAFYSGDKLNFLALAIALFIDVLVLFSGLIGALSASDSISRHFGRHFTRTQADNFIRALDFRMQDDETLPVAKALLQHMKPFVQKSRGFFNRVDDTLIAKIDINDVPYGDDRLVLQQFLLEQYAQGHAIIDDQKHDLFYLRKAVIDATRDLYLRRANDDEHMAVVQQRAQNRQAERALTKAQRAARKQIEADARNKRLADQRDERSRAARQGAVAAAALVDRAEAQAERAEARGERAEPAADVRPAAPARRFGAGLVGAASGWAALRARATASEKPADRLESASESAKSAPAPRREPTVADDWDDEDEAVAQKSRVGGMRSILERARAGLPGLGLRRQNEGFIADSEDDDQESDAAYQDIDAGRGRGARREPLIDTTAQSDDRFVGAFEDPEIAAERDAYNSSILAPGASRERGEPARDPRLRGGGQA